METFANPQVKSHYVKWQAIGMDFTTYANVYTHTFHILHTHTHTYTEWRSGYLLPVCGFALSYRLQVKLRVDLLHLFHAAVDETRWRAEKVKETIR